jgi:hypothetical protein
MLYTRTNLAILLFKSLSEKSFSIELRVSFLFIYLFISLLIKKDY